MKTVTQYITEKIKLSQDRFNKKRYDIDIFDYILTNGRLLTTQGKVNELNDIYVKMICEYLPYLLNKNIVIKVPNSDYIQDYVSVLLVDKTTKHVFNIFNNKLKRELKVVFFDYNEHSEEIDKFMEDCDFELKDIGEKFTTFIKQY
jgi:hypothetical protein